MMERKYLDEQTGKQKGGHNTRYQRNQDNHKETYFRNMYAKKSEKSEGKIALLISTTYQS